MSKRAHVFKTRDGGFRWAIYSGSRQTSSSGESFRERSYALEVAAKELDPGDGEFLAERGQGSCHVNNHKNCTTITVTPMPDRPVATEEGSA